MRSFITKVRALLYNTLCEETIHTGSHIIPVIGKTSGENLRFSRNGFVFSNGSIACTVNSVLSHDKSSFPWWCKISNKNLGIVFSSNIFATPRRQYRSFFRFTNIFIGGFIFDRPRLLPLVSIKLVRLTAISKCDGILGSNKLIWNDSFE